MIKSSLQLILGILLIIGMVALFTVII